MAPNHMVSSTTTTSFDTDGSFENDYQRSIQSMLAGNEPVAMQHNLVNGHSHADAQTVSHTTRSINFSDVVQQHNTVPRSVNSSVEDLDTSTVPPKSRQYLSGLRKAITERYFNQFQSTEPVENIPDHDGNDDDGGAVVVSEANVPLHQPQLPDQPSPVHTGTRSAESLMLPVTTTTGEDRPSSSPSTSTLQPSSTLSSTMFRCQEPDCWKMYSHLDKLRLHHQSVHQGLRPYHCPETGCGKRFSRSDHLGNHVRTHSDERPFKCTTVGEQQGCGRAFKTKVQLSAHLRTHNTEQPPPVTFHCPFPGCGWSGGRKERLLFHQQRHTGERMFRCTVADCGKAFSAHASLTYHRRVKHTNERPYPCQVTGCTDRFPTSSTRGAHYRKCHPGHSPPKPSRARRRTSTRMACSQDQLARNQTTMLGNGPYVMPMIQTISPNASACMICAQMPVYFIN